MWAIPRSMLPSIKVVLSLAFNSSLTVYLWMKKLVEIESDVNFLNLQLSCVKDLGHIHYQVKDENLSPF